MATIPVTFLGGPQDGAIYQAGDIGQGRPSTVLQRTEALPFAPGTPLAERKSEVVEYTLAKAMVGGRVKYFYMYPKQEGKKGK